MLREALSLDRLQRLPPGEAAAYLVTLGDAGLAPSEEAILAHWLAADPAHQQAFDSARRAWGVFDDAGDHEIIAAMRAHARTPRRSAPPRWAPAAGAIAAVFVAVVALTLVVRPELAPRGSGDRPPAADNAVTYASNLHEIREVRLADGTLMTLDADSTAIVRLSETRRSVRLSEGRAYFDVAADPDRPFAVAAANRQVVALGTRFDVNLQGEALVVTLLEGRIGVGSTAGDPEFRLAPGQQFEERQGKVRVRTLGPRGADAVAWRTGVVRFDDQSLAEAVAVMNRYAETPIVIRDPGVAALRISGQFRANQTDRFVATVAELHGLRVERSAQALELAPSK